MTNLIIIVSLIAATLFVCYWLYRFHSDKKIVVSAFKRNNVIVFGHKGTGKDLIFNKVINERKKKCYGNIPYNEKFSEYKPISYLNVSPNTYTNFLEDKITVIDKQIDEDVDYYLSDGGVYLPSQYEKDLCRKYPSLPIFYALSRQLGHMNIHCNTQALNRLWDKLREQADYYIKCRRTFNLGFFLVTKAIAYEEYETAKQGVLPYKRPLIFASAETRANEDQFKSTYGEVRYVYIAQLKKNIHYDTRHFHKILYGVIAPQLRATSLIRFKRVTDIKRKDIVR